MTQPQLTKLKTFALLVAVATLLVVAGIAALTGTTTLISEALGALLCGMGGLVYKLAFWDCLRYDFEPKQVDL